MHFHLGHPEFEQYSFYLPVFPPEVEKWVNDLGPVEVMSGTYDWPKWYSGFRGWTDTVNSLWWPQGADNFATCVLLIDDSRNDLLTRVVSALRAKISVPSPGSSEPADWRYPWMILSARLSPPGYGKPGEAFPPAGLPSVDRETPFLEWKLYPLAPINITSLPAVNANKGTVNRFRGLWLLPLVDIRYFYRNVALSSVMQGSSCSSSGGCPPVSYPLIHITQDQIPSWMPPLLTYPQDKFPPSHFVAIAGNGTAPSINGAMHFGEAADIQAAIEGTRIVCRDVRSGFNVPVKTVKPFESRLTSGGGTQAMDTRLTSFETSLFTFQSPTTGGPPVPPNKMSTPIPSKMTTPPPLGKSGGNTTLSPVNLSHNEFTGVINDYPENFDLEDDLINGYHIDACTFNEAFQSRKSGGLCDVNSLDEFIARKLQFLFQVKDDEYFYSVTIGTLVDFPVNIAEFGEDKDGPDLVERFITPSVVLGKQVPSRDPNTAEKDDLVTAAIQWSLLYHSWRRKQSFFKFPGIFPIIPNGHAKAIRWDFQSNAKYETTYIALEGVQGTSQQYCVKREPFYARIDGEGSIDDSLQGYYAWTKLLDKDGQLTDYNNPRKGFVAGVNGHFVSINPARDDTGKVAVPVGLVVWMKPGVPYLDMHTCIIFDHFRFTTTDLLQVVKLKKTMETNKYGHVGAIIRRWNPDIVGFVDSDDIWTVLLD